MRVLIVVIVVFLSTMFLSNSFGQITADKYVGVHKITADISWKFPPSFANKTKSKAIAKYIVVSIYNSFLFDLKQVQIISKNNAANTFIIKCSSIYLLEKLATNNQIIFIDNYVEPQTEVSIIGYDRSMHGINAVDYDILNANGKNIVVGVKEQNIDDQDLDLHKRILPSLLASNSTNYHANVISSIIGGAGNSFYDGRGIANACNFFSSSFANLFVDDVSTLVQKNVSVQNHSYGTIPQQFYGAEAKNYDEHLWNYKNFVHVFSAGNKGTQAATEGTYNGLANFANITGNFKMAKNVITVAAINGNNTIDSESSSGPTYDGRLAPEITALGPNGTSDAAAIVSGTVAVMQQVYADSNASQKMLTSLTKAILYNTATDIYTEGIDYKTGYGLLNSIEAVKAIQQKKYDGASLSQNQQWIKNINIPNNIAALKVTLSYTDSAAQLNNTKALINDLDLEVINLNNGVIFKPWVLSSFANIDSLKKVPIRKRDSINTAEQISIKLPAAGQYQIKVIGQTVVNTNISFHIAYNLDTLNTFSFTSPKHVSDINIQENESIKIKWKTFVVDTANQLGSIFVSYNSGNSWNLLQSNIKIYKNEYTWPIKDTSSTIVFKMETGFGTFFSNNIIVSRVVRADVNFLCSDSFRLSWKKHVYANSYKIFALTDSAFLKPILIVNDTFFTFQRNVYPYKVYAVEPILSNGYKASRSIAFDIAQQGVNCFYKTLNYNLLDNNSVELILDLSIAEYVDSVFFEEVTVNGSLIKLIGLKKVNNNNLKYNAFGDVLKNGITYFRAKIKLKSGAIVYTDIINVLTSGNSKIMFYPNPTTTTNGLKYILQQGISINNSLLFYDSNGRYLKGYKTLPNKIDLSLFPTGIIIYKLIDEQNQLIEQGKFIVTQ